MIRLSMRDGVIIMNLTFDLVLVYTFVVLEILVSLLFKKLKDDVRLEDIFLGYKHDLLKFI